MNIVLTIGRDHPAYAGHFPGDPILPGVVLLDEALSAIGESLGRELSACVINTVKFLSPVRPGEPVSISFTVTNTQQVRFDLTSDARRVATGIFTLSEASQARHADH